MACPPATPGSAIGEIVGIGDAPVIYSSQAALIPKKRQSSDQLSRHPRSGKFWDLGKAERNNFLFGAAQGTKKQHSYHAAHPMSPSHA